jgi:hypothetical protein
MMRGCSPSQLWPAPLTVDALVDSGAIEFCLLREVLTQLQLQEVDRRVVPLAGGGHRVVPYVAPVGIRKTRVGVKGWASDTRDAIMASEPLTPENLR